MGARIRSLANNFSSTGKLLAGGMNNASLSGITALPSGASPGKMRLLSTQTASSSSSISFTSGIDSTYDIYKFEFINMHPATDGANFQFQCSTDGGSNYNTTVTSTYFQAFHFENDSATGLEYAAAKDLAQSTSFQNLFTGQGNDNDHTGTGELFLFDPSSTTFVKHFLSNNNSSDASDITINQIPAGYFNTTSAVNAVQFKFSSGNIDAGTIKLYGISTS